MMRIAAAPIGIVKGILDADAAARNAGAGDKGPPEARQLLNTCEGCGRGLNTKQRK